MYLRITDRCNMCCAHCCYACTSKGADMSEEIFRKAVDLCEANGDLLSIGGGEPTIHPLFWPFIGYAIGKQIESIWLATNGKETRTALALAKMAKAGVIGVDLSQDMWHEPIDPRVVEAFKRDENRMYGERSDDLRAIRTTSSPVRSGRWKEDNDHGILCPCEEIVVNPDGTVRQCGCLRSPVIGSVFTGFKAARNGDGDPACYRSLKKKNRAA